MAEPAVPHPGSFWRQIEDGRLRCELCPRYCQLHEGQRGFCFVRQNQNSQMMLTTYGRSSGFCIDPIEKKPLNHFFPGSSVLSFGTAGCNLGCKFCQNWDISKSRSNDTLARAASPEAIARAAKHHGCSSVAMTYNDPVIFAEYAIDTAEACRALGIHSIVVSAGYITAAARPAFFRTIDAANIDLKAFSGDFYRRICLGKLEPVLDTLRYLYHETEVWLEITTLLIPGENNSDEELAALANWICRELGPEVPLHFTAFHPDYRMLDRPSTPAYTLTRSRTLAMREGLQFVYTGNVNDTRGGSTHCPSCQELLVERDWYRLGRYGLDPQGRCARCQTKIPGKFGPSLGHWQGGRRMIRIEA